MRICSILYFDFNDNFLDRDCCQQSYSGHTKKDKHIPQLVGYTELCIKGICNIWKGSMETRKLTWLTCFNYNPWQLFLVNNWYFRGYKINSGIYGQIYVAEKRSANLYLGVGVGERSLNRQDSHPKFPLIRAKYYRNEKGCKHRQIKQLQSRPLAE